MSPSLRRVPRAAAVVRLGATVLAAVTLLSCVRDQATAPPTRAPGANPQHSTITTLGTYSIPIPAVNADGGAQPIASTGITVPAGTYYRVRVNGSVIVSPNPAHQAAYPGRSYDQAGTYGPGGTGQGAWDLLVLLKARNTDGSGTNNINIPNLQYGTTAPDSARSDILYASKETDIQAGRNGIGGVTNDNCCNWAIGYYALSASQTVTVEKITDLVHLVANPVLVHSNRQVTFTASRDDGGTLAIDHWWWQPDAGQSGNPTQPCWSLNPCQTNVAGSGTMYVYTNVGNASVHVTVYTNFHAHSGQDEHHAG